MGGNLMDKAVSKVSKKEEKEEVHEEVHKPKFVKHLNKTRTMSAKQKWEWAFDKILTVSESNFRCLYSCIDWWYYNSNWTLDGLY